MLSKKVSLAALILVAALVAGCSSFLPATPPGETQTGAISVSVDLSELEREQIAASGAGATLVKGSSFIDVELPIVGSMAAGSVHGVATGTWQATVTLFDAGGQELTSRRLDVAVQRNATAEVTLSARVLEQEVQLVLPVEAPEPGDDPGHPDPGDGPGDDQGGGPGGDPGDQPGSGPGNDPGMDPGDGKPGDDPGSNEPGDDPEPPAVTREVRYIQSGSRTETRTEVYIIRSPNPGPTAFLVGGMHGSETSGWIVAGEVAKTWTIDRGTLVVIPEANKAAVRRQRRTGTDGRNLNRYFPTGRDIGTSSSDWLLAKEIWDVVLEFQPVALLDLHEGWGLREAGDKFSDGTLSVGQTVIVYPSGDARDFAEHVIEVLNTHHNPFYGKAGLTYNFRIIGPPVAGSLARKAGADLGIPAFIFEPTQGRAGRHQTTVAQRSAWQRVMVEEFLRWYGLID
ncbi:MAG: hypothetical protein BAA04_10535 [Firmicutes bacterium ZCTH02-B6]|nr:MAG: hypothetical protein BAA04_10535 [Firmicutes bacterium ZCTH02-B6]